MSERKFKLMTIQECAEYLNIPLNTLYKNYKKIPHHRFGNRIYFCQFKIEDYLEEEFAKTMASQAENLLQQVNKNSDDNSNVLEMTQEVNYG